MYQLITFGSTILMVALILLVFRKKSNESFSKILKILTILFCIMGFFRFMLSDAFVYVINGNGGYINGQFYQGEDILQTILRWGYYLSYAVVPMAVFFENRLFRNIASYICLPFAILSVVYFNDFMAYFLSPLGNGLKLVPWIRYAYFATELALVMVIELLVQIRYKHVFNVKSKKEWITFLVALPFILLQLMPVYVPQSIFGLTSISIHIPWMIITVVELVFLYYFFRFRSYEDRFQLIVFLTLVLFYHYDSLYLKGFSIPRLPVQLCNLAAYIYLIAIIFKSQKIFNFCYIINIVGTLIAILAPDFSKEGPIGFWNMHYTFEHMLVLIIPILCMSLRIFKRIDRKALKHAIIGFLIYFVFCVAAGTVLNAYAIKDGSSVNYFFIFSVDKAASYVPFIRFVERYPVVVNGFEIYPILMLIIFVTFMILCLVWYWLAQKIYLMNDDHHELRKARIDLYEKITGKKSKSKKEYED